jgi:hypothetical protein
MLVAIRRKRTKSGGPATPVASEQASGATEVPFVGTKAEVPEWMTDAWKRHVEADSRRQLKDRIHGVGANR